MESLESVGMLSRIWFSDHHLHYNSTQIGRKGHNSAQNSQAADHCCYCFDSCFHVHGTVHVSVNYHIYLTTLTINIKSHILLTFLFPGC